MRPRVLMAAALVIIALAAGAWWLRRERPLAEPPRPASVEGLDPAVGSLIDQLLDRTTASPGEPELRARLAMAFHANGLLEPAEEAYRQALGRDGTNAAWWELLAMCRHDNGDHAGAIVAAERAVSLDAGSVSAGVRLGGWLLEAGRLDEAEQVLRRVEALGPGDPGCLTTLARVQLAADDPEAAARTLGRVNRAPGTAAYVDQLLGLAFHRLGRTAEARRLLASATPEPPSWPDPRAAELAAYRRSTNAVLERADALAAAGRHGEAIAVLEERRRERPRDVVLLAKLGELCLGAARPEDARRHLDEAVRIDDSYTPAHLHLSRLARVQGDLRAAQTHANRAIRLQPGFGPAHLELGNALMSAPSPDWAEVERVLAAAIRFGAADTDTRLNLALAQLQQGRTDDAAETAARVLDGHPYAFRALMMLALIHLERDDLDAAEPLARRAAELRPDDPEVVRTLAEIARRQRTGARR